MSDQDDQIYMFLVNYIKENGFPPSYREIAAGIGINSMNTVMGSLRRLEMMGKNRSLERQTACNQVVGYQFVKVDGAEET